MGTRKGSSHTSRDQKDSMDNGNKKYIKIKKILNSMSIS